MLTRRAVHRGHRRFGLGYRRGGWVRILCLLTSPNNGRNTAQTNARSARWYRRCGQVVVPGLETPGCLAGLLECRLGSSVCLHPGTYARSRTQPRRAYLSWVSELGWIAHEHMTHSACHSTGMSSALTLTMCPPRLMVPQQQCVCLLFRLYRSEGVSDLRGDTCTGCQRIQYQVVCKYQSRLIDV